MLVCININKMYNLYINKHLIKCVTLFYFYKTDYFKIGDINDTKA